MLLFVQPATNVSQFRRFTCGTATALPAGQQQLPFSSTPPLPSMPAAPHAQQNRPAAAAPGVGGGCKGRTAGGAQQRRPRAFGPEDEYDRLGFGVDVQNEDSPASGMEGAGVLMLLLFGAGTGRAGAGRVVHLGFGSGARG